MKKSIMTLTCVGLLSLFMVSCFGDKKPETSNSKPSQLTNVPIVTVPENPANGKPNSNPQNSGANPQNSSSNNPNGQTQNNPGIVQKESKLSPVTVSIGPLTETYKPGSKISVPIKLSNSKEINNLNFSLKFNKDVLKFVDATVGTIIPENRKTAFKSNALPDGIVTFLYVDPTQGSSPISTDGLFATVSFEVLSTAAAGSYPLNEISDPKSRYTWDTADKNLDTIKTIFVGTTVNIKK